MPPAKDNQQQYLNKVWKSFNMPVEEEEILHQYFGAIFYDKKKSPHVYVGKVFRRFLNDEQGVAPAL